MFKESLILIAATVLQAHSSCLPKKCFAPVICSSGNNSNPDWIQVYPPPTCSTKKKFGNTTSATHKKLRGLKGDPGRPGVAGPPGLRGEQGYINDTLVAKIVQNEIKDSILESEREGSFNLNSSLMRVREEMKTALSENKDHLNKTERRTEELTEEINLLNSSFIQVQTEYKGRFIHNELRAAKLEELIEQLNSSLIGLQAENKGLEGRILETERQNVQFQTSISALQAENRAFDSSLTTMKAQLKIVTGRQDVTEVWHDMMGEILITTKCETSGCYSSIPKYSLNDEQIRQLVARSIGCRQYIKFRCQGVRLFADDMGWWVSTTGEKMKYWGGATSRRPGYCACGETGTCINPANKCNCDQNANDVMAQDEGYLTDKTKLPVRELKFGDMGDALEIGWHTLGKLECWGRA